MRGGTQRAPWAGTQPPPQPPPEPPSKPEKRNHGGGHPRASPPTVQAVLTALDTGQSYTAAAKTGGVSPATARRWWRENRNGDPPGKGSGKGGHGPASTLTPAEARKALKLRGERRENGRWQMSIREIAERLGVSRMAVQRALGKEEKRTEERQS